ncbi:MAG: LuxR family transcriptional regulator [Chloroflexota bacterium]
MEVHSGASDLVGRDTELVAIARHLDRLASGPAGIVIGGEAGIGKTSLWSATVDACGARGIRVLVARPVAAELSLGHAALGDLLGGTADTVTPAIPEAQARALAAALGWTTDVHSVEPLLLGRAVLSAFRALAGDTPLLVAVDDAQWLDSSSARALAFAARRLADSPIGFAITLREGHEDPLQLATALGDGCLTLSLGGLSLGAMGHLLRTRASPTISRRRLLGIHERAGGNPFFALEITRVAPDDDALPAALTDLVDRRLATAVAGQSAIELLAVTGPMPVGEFPDPAALDAAVTDGVCVERDGLIQFSHPLLAAGAYARIPPARRQELHRHAAASADALEPRARHLALAAAKPDREVALVLDGAAASARARGAPESAARFAAQARRLTPPGDEADASRRTVDEAEYLLLADDQAAARTLVDPLLSGAASGEVRVRALFVVALTTLNPREAVSSLEAAVAEPHDDGILAARALAQLAWQRGAWLGDVEPAIDEALAAVARAEEVDDPATLVTALTTAGLILSLSDRPGAAEHFDRALAITDRVPLAVGDRMPRVAYAMERAWRGHFRTAEELLGEARRTAEEQGNEWVLMRLNEFEADVAMRRGRWDGAAALLEAALEDAVGYWRARGLVLRAILRARRGDSRALDDAAEIRASPAAVNDPLMSAAADFALGLLDHAAGRTSEAAERVARLVTSGALAGSRSAEFAVHIPEVVSILVEAGRLDEARSLGEAIIGRSVQLAPWSDAAGALCLGLVAHADGRLEDSKTLLADARARFDAMGATWDLSQALLAEGSLLRRLGQRRGAEELLDRAIGICDSLGAAHAAARAREELRRARPRRRTDDSLTPAESRVATLVAAGLTNREIAAQQFTTVATVEAHLTRIYSKLGMRSRTELTRRVTDGSLDLATD